MRLIDADRLKEVFERNFAFPDGFKQIVDAQPTVFNTDGDSGTGHKSARMGRIPQKNMDTVEVVYTTTRTQLRL